MKVTLLNKENIFYMINLSFWNNWRKCYYLERFGVTEHEYNDDDGLRVPWCTVWSFTAIRYKISAIWLLGSPNTNIMTMSQRHRPPPMEFSGYFVQNQCKLVTREFREIYYHREKRKTLHSQKPILAALFLCSCNAAMLGLKKLVQIQKVILLARLLYLDHTGSHPQIFFASK